MNSVSLTVCMNEDMVFGHVYHHFVDTIVNDVFIAMVAKTYKMTLHILRVVTN